MNQRAMLLVAFLAASCLPINDAGGDYPGTLYDITVTVPGESKPRASITTKKYEQVSADD